MPQHTRASVPHAALYRSKKINKMTSVISPHCESHIIQSHIIVYIGWVCEWTKVSDKDFEAGYT